MVKMIIEDDNKIKDILTKYKTIAVVGCSKDPSKASNRIPAMMKKHGYKIIPVNPTADVILGEKCYHSLKEIRDLEVDMINIFRPGSEVPKIIEESLFLNPKVIWLQLGISSEEGAKISEKNGIDIVIDRCIKIEYSRLL